MTENKTTKSKAVRHSGKKAGQATNCESCACYVYDEEYEYYVCEANLDEDEMSAFLRGSDFSCPYYQLDDEYRVVRKQM